ncbi:MAG: hypothetical protein JL50_09920 [Peptococcaceae bacterium BICA1-7]|nr:MAG: hypothetical protein JL50_09920 [Peptococcaceae bacterium BICA1-7]HBV95598.1 radical SAM protein [Desulfotomaculum sp.]
MKAEKWAALKEKLDKKYQYINSLRRDGLYPGRFRLPLYIEFDLTAGCNMRCLHCYNKSGDADQKTALKAAHWLGLCRELVDSGGVFLCNLSGGEPLLLGDDLIKIMDVLHQDGTIFILNTNGYLVDEGWVKKLSKFNYSYVQVSIDGIGEVHDRLRQKKGSFQRAVRAAELFAEAGMTLSITSMVTPENLDSMEQMVDLAGRVGAVAIGFSPVMYSGRSINHQELFLNNEQLNRLQVEACRLNAQNTIGVSYMTGQSFIYGYIPSSSGRFIIIRPSGDIRINCAAPFVLGNILEEPFTAIWQKKSLLLDNNPRILEYFSQFDEDICKSSGIINFVDSDIRL